MLGCTAVAMALLLRLAHTALAAGLITVAPWTSRPAKVSTPILVYHSISAPAGNAARDAYAVSASTFAAQMDHLAAREIAVISLDALVASLTGGPAVPERAVVITFDDGWRSQYAYAFPVLQRHGFTATFFVFTNPIGRSPRFMTWAQVTDLRRAGMTIGSHGWTHPHLTTASPRELQQEIVESRQTLEQRLGTRITLFAYPFGEHPPAAEDAVRRAGYVAARGFPGGTANDASTLWALRAVPAPDSLAAFRSLVGR